MNAARASSGNSSQQQKQQPANASLHERIERALLADAELRAVHVHVHNVSCWYAQRAALGGRNHLTRQVTLNPKTLKWESKVYQMRRSKEDFTARPQLVFLSTHNSKLQAYKHCEAVAQQRDATPVEKAVGTHTTQGGHGTPGTHFRVVVVSDRFRRKGCMERVEFVHEALLRQIGETASSRSSNLAECTPGYVRGFSVVGQTVASLDFLRYICGTGQPHLVVEAKTPSQWNPVVSHNQ
jgi:stress-induced morphogen